MGDDLDRFRRVVGILGTALAAAGTQRTRKSITHDDRRKAMRQCKNVSGEEAGVPHGAVHEARSGIPNETAARKQLRKADPPERWESAQAKRRHDECVGVATPL